MRRSLSYVDAVKMLGGGENALVKVLDRVSAVGLLAVPGINLAGTCREVVRLGDELLTRLGERLRGMDRMTRTERLRAAHAVIVLTAYFDVLEPVLGDLPSGREVRISTAGQVSLAGGGPVDPGLRGIAGALIGVDPVPPDPLRSREAAAGILEGFYGALSGHVEAFISGLSGWEAMGQAQRGHVANTLGESVPHQAVGRYEELFRRLANDCPEFAIWANMSDHQATRAEMRHGLADLGHLLESVASGRVPDQRRAALARTYQAALARPIAPSGEIPAELNIPGLGEGYVDHRMRIAEMTASSEPENDSWWRGVPVRDDACRFLAGYLTSPAAREAPLVLLGQPGSGKSVLTRILAARLPAADFLPVRVELRQVPAEEDLQAQIEFAVRDATGENVAWPRLVESGDGALPVVMLDGFDELLQATGVSQSDFLMKALAFQEREADQGRPVAVIVTSRTAVTSRARIPYGALAARLEPFDEAQVTAWLEVWQRCNAATLAGRGQRPLPAEVALNHPELAEQPLLLLMLALYDADTNALQRRSGQLGSTELYERLLKEFARREIRKHSGAQPEAELEHAVEDELLRMSVVAFAMFNRRSQWVSEEDLDTDLSVLPGGHSPTGRSGGMRAQLTAAQMAVGRFFFVHESQATRDDKRLQTYEFLHATFGEFLVARLVTQVLAGMVAQETATIGSPLGAADDGLLHALLSFAALTARGPIVTFLADLLNQMDPPRRAASADLLLRLHAQALYPRAGTSYDGYQPLRLTVTARHAAWSANLFVLAVLTAGEVNGAQLFPHQADPAIPWRDQAMMWRSQLAADEWFGLNDTFALQRTWHGQRRDMRLWRNDGTFRAPAPDIHWTYNIPPGRPEREGVFAWAGHLPGNMQRKNNFACGKSDDVMTHGLEPFASAFPSVANLFVNLDGGRPVSATNALLAALVASYQDPGQESPAYLNLARVTAALALASASTADHDYTVYLKTALGVLVSAVEHGAAPPSALQPLAETTHVASPGDAQLTQLIARLHRLTPA